jgi:hypothetical protein
MHRDVPGQSTLMRALRAVTASLPYPKKPLRHRDVMKEAPFAAIHSDALCLRQSRSTFWSDYIRSALYLSVLSHFLHANRFPLRLKMLQIRVDEALQR